MKPVFDARNVVGCALMISNFIGSSHLTQAQLVALETDGWEIMSHTKTHPDLNTLTTTQIIDEFEGSKAALEAMGLTINNVAYPHNRNNENVRCIAKDYYRSGRAGGEVVNPATLSIFQLSSYNADDHTLLAGYKAMVDEAETNSRWLIFYLHVTDENDAITIGSLIDYIQLQDIPIVTVDQALDLLGY